MKKKYVYVIIDGCIEDTAVYGVYSSKKRAEEEIKDNAKKYYDPYIETWEINNNEGRQY